MLIPPEVTIKSFFRSVMKRNPSSSIRPMSPVRSQPSGETTRPWRQGSSSSRGWRCWRSAPGSRQSPPDCGTDELGPPANGPGHVLELRRHVLVDLDQELLHMDEHVPDEGRPSGLPVPPRHRAFPWDARHCARQSRAAGRGPYVTCGAAASREPATVKATPPAKSRPNAPFDVAKLAIPAAPCLHCPHWGIPRWTTDARTPRSSTPLESERAVTCFAGSLALLAALAGRRSPVFAASERAAPGSAAAEPADVEPAFAVASDQGRLSLVLRGR